MNLSRIPALMPVVGIVFSLATSGLATADHTYKRPHTHKKDHGLYFGGRGGWGALQSSLSPTSTFLSTGHYRENAVGDVRGGLYINRAKAQGAPLRDFENLEGAEAVIARYIPERFRADVRQQLEAEGCANPGLFERCYVIHEPNHFYALGQSDFGEINPLFYQAGLILEETTETSVEADHRGSYGAMLGYRSGPVRLEVDAGVDLFEVTTTTRVTRRITEVRPTFDRIDLGTRTRRIENERINRFIEGQREELPAAGVTTTTAAQDVKAYTFSANAFLDLDLGTSVKPYVGGGGGYAFIGDFDGDPHLTWNLQTGLSAPLTSGTTLSFGYKFQRIEKTVYGDLDSHTGQASLRVDF